MLFLKLGLMFTLPHSPAINYVRQHEPHTWQAEARACLRGSGTPVAETQTGTASLIKTQKSRCLCLGKKCWKGFSLQTYAIRD